MGDELELASKEPWWVRAPAALAIGIVGVPSLIAISAGWFIAANLTHRINLLDQYNLSEIHILNEQNQRWEAVKDFMELEIRIDMASCLNMAKDAQERDRCIRGSEIKIPDPPQ